MTVEPDSETPLTVAEALDWADAHTVADLGTLPRTEWALVRLAAEVRRLQEEIENMQEEWAHRDEYE